MVTNIFETIGIPVDYVVIGLFIFQIILFILLIVSLCKIGGMKKKYYSFMSGSDGKSLETAVVQKFKLIDRLDDSVKEVFARLKDVDDNLMVSFQKMGLVKYDAFKEIGGKMSFVLVLLTKENSGIMMNCMHSNSEGCYTYVKRITKGSAKAALSKEEELALAQAMGNEAEAEIN